MILLACAAPAADTGQVLDTGDTAVERNFSRAATAGPWTVSYVPTPDPIPLNEPFTLTFDIQGGNESEITLDAIMPEHKHGMPTQPVVTQNADLTWTANGMLFQMEGHWRLTLGVDLEVANFDVECCE